MNLTRLLAVEATKMAKDFGGNLNWFLSDVSCADADQIESSTIDIYGETEQGADTSCEVDLRELCGAALQRIEDLERFIKWALDNGATEQDFKHILAASNS
jgi:hypothetical protein